MNINNYLKSIGKTKTELARDLNISRPTINQYIELYESGQKIENERYDIIFHRLFSDPNMNQESFEQRISSVKFLLERDRKYDIGNLSPEAADIVARIHNNMVRDMNDDSWDKKIYDYILIILSTYRKNTIIRELSSYFSDLNSDSNLSEQPFDSRAYYAYFFTCFKKIKDGVPFFDEKEYSDFLKRKEQNSKERKNMQNQKTNSIKKRLTKTLEEVELDFQKDGINASEQEIMSEVIRRMRNTE